VTLDARKADEFCRSFGFLRPYTDLNLMLDDEKPDACVCIMPIDQIVEKESTCYNVEFPV
jgi:predicted dehydrogenase